MLRTVVLFSAVFILLYILFKGYRVKAPVLKRPESFSGKQIKMLVVIDFFVEKCPACNTAARGCQSGDSRDVVTVSGGAMV